MRISSVLSCLMAGIACLSANLAGAQESVKVDPSSSLQQKSDKGWFFYEEPVKPKEEKFKRNPPPAAAQTQAQRESKKKEDICFSPDTWVVECGFVDPGKNMKFQARMRDALLDNMALSKNDPKAVEQFQFYMKFVMERATEVANNWYFNLVQNPNLDAASSSPISPFGLDLMSKVKSSKQRDLFDTLKSEKAFLIYFTRTDCVFCHQMMNTILNVAKEIGIPVYNASLDEKCMPGMEQGCLAGESVIPSASRLEVTIVPSLFLYIPDKTFIRISTGVVDSATILQRVSTFFNAYRTALLKGINNSIGQQPSVDFSTKEASGTAPGVASKKSGTPALREGSEFQNDTSSRENISKDVNRMLMVE